MYVQFIGEAGCVMLNEHITENIVRNLLRQLGYYDNSSCVIEEQKSANSRIQKLLQNASKGGSGVGQPEFIISFKDDTNFLIIIECKSSLSKHESKTRDQYKHYAIDGVLNYSNYLSKDYNVMAIAISGETERELKISNFLQLKGAYVARDITDKQLLDYQSYKTSFQIQSKPLKDDELVKKAIEYNELLHKYSVPETERNTLISTILIALQDTVFVESFHKYDKNKDLVSGMLEACSRVLEYNQISDSRKETILHEYRGISHNQTLISETIKDEKKKCPNIILKTLINDLKNDVLPFIRENDFDILGRFYREFIRYAGKDWKTGLVLTPTHATNFFCDLIDLQTDDIVYDPCCGTGGFLVSAMKHMINKAGNNINEWKEIKQNRLIGVEVRSDMFTHACSNMMMRGDGKSNIFNGNCFDDEIVNKVKSHKPNKGFLNPPYDVGSDGQLEFIEQTLKCLIKGGKCVAICQISVGIKQDQKTIAVRERLLKHHTLNAVFSMPDQLFYPKAVVTSILVFTSHIPHPPDKEVFFGYLKDDGHVLKKHKGRLDDGSWGLKKEQMINLFVNKKSQVGLSTNHQVISEDEWCAEAYIETYFNFCDTIFVQVIRNYLSYCISVGDICAYNVLANCKKFKLDFPQNLKLFKLNDLFMIKKGKRLTRFEMNDGKTPYLGASSLNNGVTGFIDEPPIHKGGTISINYDGSVGEAFYQNNPFYASDAVNVLYPKNFKLTPFVGLFLCAIIRQEKYRFNYGRKWHLKRMEKTLIEVPTTSNGQPDWQFMEDYIKSLPYSSTL